MSDMYKLDDKFFEADTRIKENRIGEATALLNEIITEMPAYGRAHNHLGWIYETKFTDYTRAEKHYKAALEFSPEYTATYYNYSILLSTLGKHADLENLLEKALTIPGINKSTIHNERGIMREAQGRYPEAIQEYRTYIRYLYDNKLIELAMESIRRCENKINLGLDGNFGFKAP
jgi:tetratricopeptide (TPR) repeat protein